MVFLVRCVVRGTRLLYILKISVIRQLLYCITETVPATDLEGTTEAKYKNAENALKKTIRVILTSVNTDVCSPFLCIGENY